MLKRLCLGHEKTKESNVGNREMEVCSGLLLVTAVVWGVLRCLWMAAPSVKGRTSPRNTFFWCRFGVVSRGERELLSIDMAAPLTSGSGPN